MKKYLKNFIWIGLSPLLYLLAQLIQFDLLFLLFILYLSALYGACLNEPTKVKEYLYKIALLIVFIVPSFLLAMTIQLTKYASNTNSISVLGISSYISKWFRVQKDTVFFAFLSILFFGLSFLPLGFLINDISLLFGWIIHGIVYSLCLFLLEISIDGIKSKVNLKEKSKIK